MANFNNLDITYREKYCGAVASESGGFVVWMPLKTSPVTLYLFEALFMDQRASLFSCNNSRNLFLNSRTWTRIIAIEIKQADHGAP